MSTFALWRHRFLLLIFIILTYPALAATPGKRIALVIGNSAYKDAPLLANPTNDAEDVAKTLSGLGFQVTKSLDLNKAEMDRALSSFASSLKGAEVGLFYYAGHGLQVSGQNYLVPVDARLESPSALDFEAVRLDVVQRIMENETQTNVLILDACRDNPLTRNLARSMGARSGAIGKGLAAQESGAGTIISYSTQPGNVALDGTGKRNSPFAEALVKHLPSEGRDLSSVLVRVRNDVMAATAKRQVPWEHSALTDELVLAQRPAEAPPKAVTQSIETKAAAGKVEETANAAESKAEKTKSIELADVKPEVPKQELPASGSIFSDSFDGNSLREHWSVINENSALYDVQKGLLILVATKNTEADPNIDTVPPFSVGKHSNVLRLDGVALADDWDMAVRLRPRFATKRDRFTVALLEDQESSISASLVTQGNSCSYVTLLLIRSGAQKDTDEADVWGTNKCFGRPGKLSEEEYAKNLEKLREEGGTLTLSKRGPVYSANFTSPLLANPVRTKEFVVLRAGGRPMLAISQWGVVSGEAAVYVDEIQITSVK